ncbi:hypothetical protein [Phytohabitans houttuyneae]|uniref:Uncharacterized protein n=1 Tax=Phytohabitans houttuyneae TaxID=1076126 RepID=A0A6V8KCG1_9ACTN|nr:hypothetical protein [Phytohabitans houttuyneae]GFJ79799.1 hypothetical protein Phou_039790 [Phytohabitans houttuyneae]
MTARNTPHPLARAGRVARVLGPIAGIGAALSAVPGVIGTAGALLAIAAGMPAVVLGLYDVRRWLRSGRR